MKPKDYVKKYRLDQNAKFNHNEFVQDLTIDFTSLMECGKKLDGAYTIKGFENTVKAIRMKWDGITNKTLGNLPEKLWNYFYATVIVKMREELFPDIMEQRRQNKKQKQEWYKKRNEWEEEMFRNMQEEFLNSILFSMSFKQKPPIEDMELLGLSEGFTVDDVKKSYRKLSMKNHPDKGGNQKLFIRITEAKNKCLAYKS